MRAEAWDHKGDTRVAKDSDPSAIELGIDTTKQTVGKATASVKAHARTAGRIAVLTAERAKIANVSLPSAYAELGKQVYTTRTWESDFLDLFKELDAVGKAVSANATPKPLSTANTLTEKAKALAEKGIQVANAQKLALQQKVLLARLGKTAYEKHGVNAGPDALIKAVEPLSARLVALDKELAVNVQKAGGKKRVAVIAVGIVVALAVVGGILGGGASTDSGRSGTPVFFGPGGKVNTNTVTGKSFSKKQIAGLFAKAKSISLGMPEQAVMETLGTPTESSRTDYDKVEMSPQLKAGLQATVPTFNPNPSPMTIYAWTMKGREKESYVMIAVQDGRVISVTVKENGVQTVDRM
jgi:hypothetical protein